MRTIKDYTKIKKNYINTQDLNSNNIYDYLTDVQIKVIQKYYEVYTKYLFNKLMGSLRLEVSPSKAKKLIALKGSGEWEFAGMIDMRIKGAATCELGHPLRYVYFAKNVQNGQVLQFGSRCVGDFFSIDEEGIKALSKVKEVMFSEMKELVAIKNLNLYNEHYAYDCSEIGKIILNLGVEGVKKIKENSALMSIVIGFLSVNLPLPMSLIEQIEKSGISFEEYLNDFSLYDIDIELLEKLKISNISVISKMFVNSERDIKSSIKNFKIISNKSDFFNFRTVSDLRENMNIWKQREKLLSETHDFFVSKGMKCKWLDLYKLAVRENYKRDDVEFDRCLRLLSLFDKNIEIQEGYYPPFVYKYNGYTIDEDIEEDFDSLINSFAGKSFIMNTLELIDIKNKIDKKIEEEEEEKALMMVYLKENLPLDKYESVRGIVGVRDIVLTKGIKYQDMSDKQYYFVESVYKSMLNIDKQGEQKSEKNVNDSDINNRYTLLERPDILAKIQRLQNEAIDKLRVENERTVSIMETVLKTQKVSDKQIKYINDAFSKYILGEEPKTVIEENAPLAVSKPENRKWNLVERPDVQEKVLAIKNHPEFSNMYSATQNIIENILKYKSVSEKQIESVEKTYNRFFKR